MQEETLPLTEDEQEHLMVIYYTRRRVFISAFAAMMMFALLGSFRGWKTDDGDHPEDYEIFGHEFLGMELYLLLLTFIVSIIAILGFRTYRKFVLCYKKDAQSGVKVAVLYRVIDKKYFSQTGQFYLSLNNPAYMHHEVDEAMYHSVIVGESIYIYKGRLSGYVFQKDGRFTLM